MYSLPTNASEDIKYFGTLIDEFLDGKIEPVKFKATRVPMGIYEQRKDGTFMVRIRCAAGFISPKQLKAVTEIAHSHGSELIHITTRQEIQIQNIALRDALPILQSLKEVGLSTKGGGGNTVRNILTSVSSGVETGEVFDVSAYAFNLTSKLIAEPDSFTLPRKFKIAFSNSEADSGFVKFNDLGFIAQIKDGKRGFKVYLGGGLASKPTVGFKLFDFVPENDLFYVAAAAKTLFSQHGNRKNKHKARLRYVFYKLGEEEVFRLFFEIYNELKAAGGIDYIHTESEFKQVAPEFASSPAYTPDFREWKERYATEQKQTGYYTIIVPFENGNSNYKTLAKIAEFASGFGKDTIRFSMRQNLHLRNIPDAYLGNLFDLLLSLKIEVQKPLLINTLVSCTGADTCRLGICLSKGASNALKKHLAKSTVALDKLGDLRINISGCPNSCGQQITSDLGFFGKVSRNDRMYPAYHVVAGAAVGEGARLAEVLGEISARDLPSFTSDVLALYAEKSKQFPTYAKYFDVEGRTEILTLIEKYKDVPEFADDKNYYFDWGSDQVFSLAARGVGECSAGLFDMIDVDLNTIQTARKQLESVTEPAEVNRLLYTITFATSRMLLITRGEEPKTVKDAFNSFITKFIDAKIVSSVFREVVEIARDHADFDFSTKRDTIEELAQAVITLYEGMDDSLQFKLSVSTSAPLEQPASNVNRTKDFRGVACPMNFVKTKIELSSLQSDDVLEILLDDGAPIQNVPGSVRNEGHTVLSETKIDNYWQVIIKKGK